MLRAGQSNQVAGTTRGPGEGRGTCRRRKERTTMTPKNTISLWFDKDAEEAARFYAATFPDSKVTAVRKAPADALAAGGAEARRAFEAMMPMTKIDVAAIEAAVRG
jgi:predicted 3-demethylubiquinone-9 3-methyltransferase (glyoxalase superfamily)